MGTAAHAFTLLFDREEDAFRAQVDAMGVGTTLLVDTYEIPDAVETAVRVAGTELGAVRIDSGDLAVRRRARCARNSTASARRGTHIIVTNDLDEYAIEALRSAPVDSFGVGTAVVTGSGAPAAGFVYKLAAHLDDDGAWMPVGKRSAEKATVAGRKQPVRALRDGVALAEHIYVEEPPAEGVGRELLVDLVVDGEPVDGALGPDGRARRARAPRRGDRGAAAGGPRAHPAATPPSRRSTSRARASRRRFAALSSALLQLVVDLLAVRADRELLGVAARNPDLAAQGAHRLAGHRRLEDLLLLHVVRVAIVVAVLVQLLVEQLLELAVEQVGSGAAALARAVRDPCRSCS